MPRGYLLSSVLCTTFVLESSALAALYSRLSAPIPQASKPTSSNPRTAPCTVEYFASPLEQRWVTNISQWQTNDPNWGSACKAWAEDEAKGRWDRWLKALRNNTRLANLSRDIFSYHLLTCPGSRRRKLYLEPLAAALRSPKYPCGDGGLFDTSYLALPHALDIPYRKAYFFDLGSTFYDQGMSGSDDSLSWFMESYKKRGWKFNDIFAWEMKPLNHADYWLRVPDDIKLKLRFFNVPCTSDPDSGMNPLRFIQSIARPEDYVVLKLDIDDNPTEVSLVLQILESPTIAKLIDELYWENHVQYSPIQQVGWGDLSQLKGPISTLDSSYATFQKLRAMGIRAHSWV